MKGGDMSESFGQKNHRKGSGTLESTENSS
jgi:hypothetical protein